jgi:hypothetical protein
MDCTLVSSSVTPYNTAAVRTNIIIIDYIQSLRFVPRLTQQLSGETPTWQLFPNACAEGIRLVLVLENLGPSPEMIET